MFHDRTGGAIKEKQLLSFMLLVLFVLIPYTMAKNEVNIVNWYVQLYKWMVV